MALDVFTGQFTSSGSTGTQAVTGVGFQGKAIIFYCTERAVIEVASNSHRSVGFATSSTKRGSMSMSIDNSNPTGDTDNDNRDNRVILIRDHSSGTIRGEADFVSFDSDGFTIDWIDSTDVIVFFVVVGGDDLTDVDVGQFTKATSTGTDAITGVGFEPDLILLAGELNTVLNSTTPHTSFFFGAATSPTSRWVTHGSSEDGPSVSDCGRNQRTNKCIYQTDENGTAIADVDLDSMDSDGFTLDYLTANGDAHQYMYLALKGGAYNLGSFNADTSTGNQAVTGVGFTPKIEVFTSFSAATSGIEVADNRFGLGSATSSTARSHLFNGDEDGQGTTDTVQDINDLACLRYLNESQTLLAEADFVTQDSDGFTVNWGTVDLISREILYLAMDSLAVPLPAFDTLAGREITFSLGEVIAVEEQLTVVRSSVYDGVRARIYLEHQEIVVRETKTAVIVALLAAGDTFTTTITVDTVPGREIEMKAAEVEAVEAQLVDVRSPIYTGVRSNIFLADHVIEVRETAAAVLTLIENA